MFGSKKKIIAPMTGVSVNITEVNDPVFSQKFVGDGLGIIPESNEVFAPVSGTVVNVIDTKHAVGFQTDDGVEILLHLGLDTVTLNGEGFVCDLKEGDVVTVGDRIMTMDIDFVKSKGFDTTCCVLIANYSELKKYDIITGHVTATKDTVFTYKK